MKIVTNKVKTGSLEDFGRIIRKTIAGSNSYGTAREPEKDEFGNAIPGTGSDLDIRGIFVPHRKFLLGIENVHQFNDKDQDDIEYFSIQKFVSLAIEGNPNVVEQLFVSPQHVLFEDEFGKELYDMRYEFLTKNAYGRFGGYAYAQMKRMDSKGNHNSHNSHWDIVEKYGYDTKQAMHLVRLFNMGIQILTERDLHTLRPEREELLAIRYGKYTLEEIYAYADRLNTKLEEAMMNSTIPEYPDFDKINKWLISVADRVHGLDTSKGVFKGTTFNVLPLEYEMVDKSALLVGSNRLVRRKNKSEAVGIVIPYKDWFVGLRQFSEFKFEKTSIDGIHKVVEKVRSCDPKIIDLLYASDKHLLYKHPMAEEFKSRMKTLPTTKAAYYKAFNYATGNLKKMQYWEQLKVKWEKERETAKTKMSEYPPVPKNTNPENASMMTKFGYDTLTAYDVVHVIKMFTELLTTGTIIDSRSYEPELYAIKHAKYKTFGEFMSYTAELLLELEKANENSVLSTSHNFDELQEWVIDFIDKFHAQLD
jgi:predicted nucleotidyltransferase